MNNKNNISQTDGELIVKTARKVVTEFLNNDKKIKLVMLFIISKRLQDKDYICKININLNKKKCLTKILGI